MNFPDDKSMFSQIDAISQYTNYIGQKQQADDENQKALNEFKSK